MDTYRLNRSVPAEICFLNPPCLRPSFYVVLHPRRSERLLRIALYLPRIECLVHVLPVNVSMSSTEAGTRAVNGEKHSDFIDI